MKGLTMFMSNRMKLIVFVSVIALAATQAGCQADGSIRQPTDEDRGSLVGAGSAIGGAILGPPGAATGGAIGAGIVGIWGAIAAITAARSRRKIEQEKDATWDEAVAFIESIRKEAKEEAKS